MASAAVTGRKAYIRSSTAAASTATTSQTIWAEIRDYTLTFERDESDVTNHDSSGWHENLSGVAKWSCTGSVNYISPGAGQGALRAHSLGTNPALVNISFQATTSATTKKYQGKTRITGWDHNAPTNDAVLGNVSGVGSGALVRTA